MISSTVTSALQPRLVITPHDVLLESLASTAIRAFASDQWARVAVPGFALSIREGGNSLGQLVGGNSDCRNFLRAFEWDEDRGMRDLDTQIVPGSGLPITSACCPHGAQNREGYHIKERRVLESTPRSTRTGNAEAGGAYSEAFRRLCVLTVRHSPSHRPAGILPDP
jgi:hypothetical protein